MTAEISKFVCSFAGDLKSSELKGGLVAHDHHTQLLGQSTLFQSLYHAHHVQHSAACKQPMQHVCIAAIQAALVSSVHAQATLYTQGKLNISNSLPAHRQTERQTGMWANRQACRQTDRDMGGPTDRQPDRQAGRQAARQAGRQADIVTDNRQAWCS